MDEVLQAIIELKALALLEVTRYPATFRALDVVQKIAGWERASVAGDDSFCMIKKVCQIYQETMDNMKGW